MNPSIVLSLVDYINLLYRGNLDKSLFIYFEKELNECSPFEVNIAIENLILRYRDIGLIENTVARFIRSAASGLNKYSFPEYPDNSIFYFLDKENRMITAQLNSLKSLYLDILPELKGNLPESKYRINSELKMIEDVKKHYLKLQYGVFPALESAGAPTQCIKLMWHLEDSVWPKLKCCSGMLEAEDWDFHLFNKVYGHMYFLLGTLVYREDKILFPVAFDYLSEKKQQQLVAETLSL